MHGVGSVITMRRAGAGAVINSDEWIPTLDVAARTARESNIHEIDFFSCWTLLGVKLLATVTDHREVDPRDGDISTPFPSRCQLAGRSAT